MTMIDQDLAKALDSKGVGVVSFWFSKKGKYVYFFRQ